MRELKLICYAGRRESNMSSQIGGLAARANKLPAKQIILIMIIVAFRPPRQREFSGPLARSHIAAKCPFSRGYLGGRAL